MSVIDRVRAAAGRQLQQRVGALIGAESPAAQRIFAAAMGGGSGAVAGAVAGAIAGAASVRPPGRVDAAQSGGAIAAARRVAAQLSGQSGGAARFIPPPLSGALMTPSAAPSAQPAAAESRRQWSPAPTWAGLSPSEFEKLFRDSAMTERAWKNLFHVSIEELRPSKESPAGAGIINLMAVDVSFGPAAMPGEVIGVGSANIDLLNSSERVELRLTAFDDKRGALKRWFLAKCDQAAHIDGTFGLPVDYLSVVTVVHMDPAGRAGSKERLRHKFLMRPSSVEIELSRRGPELEELAMSFMQFDTFVEPR